MVKMDPPKLAPSETNVLDLPELILLQNMDSLWKLWTISHRWNNVDPGTYFTCKNLDQWHIFWMLHEATEAYTRGNQSFVFLDMPLYSLLERADLWKMQQNVHIDHCSQVSRLHRSSLLPIVHVFCCYMHSVFLSTLSAIHLTLTCVDSTFVLSGTLTYPDLPSWGWPL